MANPRASGCHRIAHASTFKSRNHSSRHRVLPLNYRRSKRGGPDSNRHPVSSFLLGRPGDQWRMLTLERESESYTGCLFQLGYPRAVVRGAGLEPALVTGGFSFSLSCQLRADSGAPPRSHGGISGGYPNR